MSLISFITAVRRDPNPKYGRKNKLSNDQYDYFMYGVK